MTKAQRAAERCEHCRAGKPTLFWQRYYTHQLYLKNPNGKTQFSHVTCAADKIWKEQDAQPGPCNPVHESGGGSGG